MTVRTYSTYQAKAHFSEILRLVRGGQRVRISYHGEEIAELRPIDRAPSVSDTLESLEARGLLRRSSQPGRLAPLADRPGALQRFLESRD